MAKAHIISIVLTAFVLVMLVLTGPASAWAASLSVPDTSIVQGERVEFIVEVELTQDEFDGLEKLVLNLAGPTNYSCEFDAEGNKLEVCEGMDIELISEPSFGYGYGYGYGYGQGALAYNISLNSNKLEEGNYSSEIVVVGDGDEDATAGDDFEILAKQTGGEKVTICHLPPGNPDNAHTLSVGADAVEAHLGHGDYLGECVVVEELSAGNSNGNGKGKKK